ncbi:MAG: glycosyltransferase [Nitrospirota bacterium]
MVSDILKIRNPEKIAVIPHASFTKIISNTTDRHEARTRLNLRQEDIVFLYLGLIRYYKGVIELVDSFKRLESRNNQLVVAGSSRDDQLIGQLRKKAERLDNIHLHLKYIPNDEIHLYMNAADVLVCPYRDVLNSGSVFLGMSFGKPIIAPRMGCIPEVLNNEHNLLYDVEEKDGLFNAINLAVASKLRLKEMGNQNLMRAKEMDWDDIAEKTVKVYKNI